MIAIYVFDLHAGKSFEEIADGCLQLRMMEKMVQSWSLQQRHVALIPKLASKCFAYVVAA